MIPKPRDWDTAQAYTGDVERMTPGGHIVKIMNARMDMSKNGRPMLVVSFDICEGSPLDGFYRRKHDSRKNAGFTTGWGGVIRFMLYASDGVSTNGFFKGFITSVEESNPGYRFNWDERGLEGKLVGLVFGEEEYLGNDGKPHTSVKAQQARSVEAIRAGVPVPQAKKLNAESAKPVQGFTEVEDDELPF